MGMTFKLGIQHAGMTLRNYPMREEGTPAKTNTVLTIMVTAARRSSNPELVRDVESIQQDATTILNEDIALWLAERRIAYILGSMEITIHNDDQAMEFKMRWL